MSQLCYRHPTIFAHTNCTACGQPICAACTEIWRGSEYCLPDYALARHQPTNLPASHSSSLQADANGVVITPYRASTPPVAASILVERLAMPPTHVTPAPSMSVRSRRITLRPVTIRLADSIAATLLALAHYLFFLELTRLLPTHGPGRSSITFQLVQGEVYLLMGLTASFIVANTVCLIRSWLARQPPTSLPTRYSLTRHRIIIRRNLVALIISIIAAIIWVVAQLTFLSWHWLPCCG